jgi:hypothetical protein
MKNGVEHDMNMNNMNITMKNGDSTSLDSTSRKKFATRKVGFLRQKSDYQKAIKSPFLSIKDSSSTQ